MVAFFDLPVGGFELPFMSLELSFMGFSSKRTLIFLLWMSLQSVL